LNIKKKYNATLYCDGKDKDFRVNPVSFGIKEKNVKFSDTILLKLAAGSCAAI